MGRKPPRARATSCQRAASCSSSSDAVSRILCVRPARTPAGMAAHQPVKPWLQRPGGAHQQPSAQGPGGGGHVRALQQQHPAWDDLHAALQTGDTSRACAALGLLVRDRQALGSLAQHHAELLSQALARTASASAPCAALVLGQQQQQVAIVAAALTLLARWALQLQRGRPDARAQGTLHAAVDLVLQLASSSRTQQAHGTVLCDPSTTSAALLFLATAYPGAGPPFHLARFRNALAATAPSAPHSTRHDARHRRVLGAATASGAGRRVRGPAPLRTRRAAARPREQPHGHAARSPRRQHGLRAPPLTGQWDYLPGKPTGELAHTLTPSRSLLHRPLARSSHVSFRR